VITKARTDECARISLPLGWVTLGLTQGPFMVDSKDPHDNSGAAGESLRLAGGHDVWN
jgi:hypothetical protein